MLERILLVLIAPAICARIGREDLFDDQDIYVDYTLQLLLQSFDDYGALREHWPCAELDVNKCVVTVEVSLLESFQKTRF